MKLKCREDSTGDQSSKEAFSVIWRQNRRKQYSIMFQAISAMDVYPDHN